MIYPEVNYDSRILTRPSIFDSGRVGLHRKVRFFGFLAFSIPLMYISLPSLAPLTFFFGQTELRTMAVA